MLPTNSEADIPSVVIPRSSTEIILKDACSLPPGHQQRFVEHSRIWNGMHQVYPQITTSPVSHRFLHQPNFNTCPPEKFPGSQSMPFNAMLFNGPQMVFNGSRLASATLFRLVKLITKYI